MRSKAPDRPRQLRSRAGPALHEFSLGATGLLQCLQAVQRQRMQPLEQIPLFHEQFADPCVVSRALRRIGGRGCRSQAALDGAIEIGQRECEVLRAHAGVTDPFECEVLRAHAGVTDPFAGPFALACLGGDLFRPRQGAQFAPYQHRELASRCVEFGMAGDALQPCL